MMYKEIRQGIEVAEYHFKYQSLISIKGELESCNIEAVVQNMHHSINFLSFGISSIVFSRLPASGRVKPKKSIVFPCIADELFKWNNIQL